MATSLIIYWKIKSCQLNNFMFECYFWTSELICKAIWLLTSFNNQSWSCLSASDASIWVNKRLTWQTAVTVLYMVMMSSPGTANSRENGWKGFIFDNLRGLKKSF